MHDCSWCAQEQGLEPTESPTICERHLALLLQQSEERRRERAERQAQEVQA